MQYIDKWSVDNPDLEDASDLSDLGVSHKADVQYCNIGHGMTNMTRGFAASISLNCSGADKDAIHEKRKYSGDDLVVGKTWPGGK